MKKWIVWIVALILLLVCTWPSNGAATGSVLLKDGQVKQVCVTSYFPGGKRSYTFTGEDVAPIIDYIAQLPLIASSPNDMSYGGSYEICIEYANSDSLTISHMFNLFVTTPDGSWYRIDYAKDPPPFSHLLYELSSK